MPRLLQAVVMVLVLLLPLRGIASTLNCLHVDPAPQAHAQGPAAVIARDGVVSHASHGMHHAASAATTDSFAAPDTLTHHRHPSTAGLCGSTCQVPPVLASLPVLADPMLVATVIFPPPTAVAPDGAASRLERPPRTI